MHAITPAVLVGFGIGVAVAAHLAIRVAERRARRVYEGLVGEDVAGNPPDDAWKGIRPFVGNWGCLVAILELLRGVGVAMALGAGAYLVASQ